MKNLYAIGLIVSWIVIFIIPGAVYVKRNYFGNHYEDFPTEGSLKIQQIFEKISSKISSHKESIDKSIQDISDKLDSSLYKMNSKIATLQDRLKEKHEQMAKVLQQINKPRNKPYKHFSPKSQSNKTATTGDISQGKQCIDTMERTEGGFPELFACHQKGGNQEWELTKDKQLKNPLRKDCLTAPRKEGKTIMELKSCSAGDTFQKWERSGKQFKVVGTNNCLDVHSDGIIAVKTCDKEAATQTWKFGL